MNKLTALLIGLFALAMLTGPSMAAEMTGGEKASVPVTSGLWKQLSPNAFGSTGDIPDGVSYDEFRGTIDQHYGVAPAWEGMAEEPLTMTEIELRRQLSPNVFGYIADGVRDDEFRGPIDKHYGVSPAWEDRPEDLTMVEKAEKELWKHLAPNITYEKDVH
jgi:hypothetical protein